MNFTLKVMILLVSSGTSVIVIGLVTKDWVTICAGIMTIAISGLFLAIEFTNYNIRLEDSNYKTSKESGK